MGGPVLPDVQTIIAAGFNPKTGLPYKWGNMFGESVKPDFKRLLRIIDEQDAINCGTWYNLPCNISSQELERMLYYKGNLCFFYNKDLDEFYFMPWALDGTIDFYGRANTIHPVPLSSGTNNENNKAQAEYLSKIKLKVVYGIKMDKVTEDDIYNSAVILKDYTSQMDINNVIPRVTLNEPLLDLMAECPAYMRTSLINATGVRGVRVNDADQANEIYEGAKSTQKAAENGVPYVPIIANMEFQDLTNGGVSKAEEYMLAMQSLDNFRLSTHGIQNNGLFEKKAHELQAEAQMGAGPVQLTMADKIAIRQNFCHIVNSIWGLGIWYEPSQNMLGADTNGDGMMYETDTDGANTGVEETQDDTTI